MVKSTEAQAQVNRSDFPDKVLEEVAEAIVSKVVAEETAGVLEGAAEN